MIFENHEQGSAAWLAARAGVITASEFETATSKLTRKSGKKNAGDPTGEAEKYLAAVAIEIISGKPFGDKFETFAMRKGRDREPAARVAYELRTGMIAEESGICFTDDKRFGYSTDGFVGDDGMVEIKCLSDSAKILLTHQEGDVSEYLHQMQGGMWITGRLWCDFILFVPELESAGTDLYIKRVYRNEEFIEQLETDLLAARDMVDRYERILRTPANDFGMPMQEAA